MWFLGFISWRQKNGWGRGKGRKDTSSVLCCVKTNIHKFEFIFVLKIFDVINDVQDHVNELLIWLLSISFHLCSTFSNSSLTLASQNASAPPTQRILRSAQWTSASCRKQDAVAETAGRAIKRAFYGNGNEGTDNDSRDASAPIIYRVQTQLHPKWNIN